MFNPYITQMLNFYKSAKDPLDALNRMMQNNPRMKQIMDYVNANGGDARSAFYKLAEEKGINPDDILSQLK